MLKKRLYIILTIFLLALLSSLFFCDQIIKDNAKGKLYSNIDATPFNKVGLVLGTAKYLANGQVNLYYNNRINGAVNLYRANKIKYIIVSGDNGRKDYYEPRQIQTDLLRLGIDSQHIFLDYAGFRTFDSIVRLKKIFGQDSVTIISQKFHNERALYIASKLNIFAIGYNAVDVDKASGLKT